MIMLKDNRHFWHSLFTSQTGKEFCNFWDVLDIHSNLIGRILMSSRKHVPTAKITAKQADKHGIPSLFKSGHVHEVTYHTGRTVAVCKFVGANKGSAIVKDDRGKRRTVPFNSIKTLMVAGHLAKQLAG